MITNYMASKIYCDPNRSNIFDFLSLGRGQTKQQRIQ